MCVCVCLWQPHHGRILITFSWKRKKRRKTVYHLQCSCRALRTWNRRIYAFTVICMRTYIVHVHFGTSIESKVNIKNTQRLKRPVLGNRQQTVRRTATTTQQRKRNCEFIFNFKNSQKKHLARLPFVRKYNGKVHANDDGAGRHVIAWNNFLNWINSNNICSEILAISKAFLEIDVQTIRSACVDALHCALTERSVASQCDHQTPYTRHSLNGALCVSVYLYKCLNKTKMIDNREFNCRQCAALK